MRWGDEVRPAAGVAPSRTTAVDEEKLAAALDLLEVRSVDTLDEVPDLTDHYAQALAALVNANLHAHHLAGPVGPGWRPQLVDLMEALRQSVQDAGVERGEASPGVASTPWNPRPRKRS
ncbi:hypothetical protein M878_46190 (plasmid) [Streptomyces roseochromogenus subsp. oscitans DS 12.976]|uniref:Uncharacterized protein n=1 Tax=Streptomyces roseochromogenus subsp. oscitans DS 12.976 TaxID=1352936 RepID=V6JDW6_STRRC|nr:hypothetical protein M878_46190 [Streptomyces roseochromogenus subsp. oscitans DS 12.976]